MKSLFAILAVLIFTASFSFAGEAAAPVAKKDMKADATGDMKDTKNMKDMKDAKAENKAKERKVKKAKKEDKKDEMKKEEDKKKTPPAK